MNATGSRNGKENRVPATTSATGNEIAVQRTAASSSHSHTDDAQPATPARAASGYDGFFNSYVESPTYLRTRTVLSAEVVEARLRLARQQRLDHLPPLPPPPPYHPPPPT
ncbi:hypothetical protein GSI_14603 [Ganoderma sinense ZZ0214-1]|uniref:Uncharacterized protein n=1 Tax=Ganoderma sinense ZZ0214-1 TaxID=1077348 RepID=A0A2G8RP73_9APHY|nr:hypothetical protein GSI_14603 [Ganoderma sinense ZZ0214-1]